MLIIIPTLSCCVSFPAVVCQELSTAELHSVYRWIDSLPLTKAKKNIARDFSDAGHTPSPSSTALVADAHCRAAATPQTPLSHSLPARLSADVLAVLLSEVLHHYHPKLVDLHNYSPALSLATKRTNWHTLNQKAFKKLHIQPLTDAHIQQLAAGQKGAIERLLWLVKQRMEEGGEEDRRGGKREEKEWFSSGGAGDVEDELVMTSDGRVQQVSVDRGTASRAGSGGVAERSRDALIADQRDAIDVLHDRITKLEQLLQSVNTPPAPLRQLTAHGSQCTPLTRSCGAVLHLRTKNAKIDALTKRVAELRAR